MRIIIRRPQAYTFARKYRGTPIPGIVFLSGKGTVEATAKFRGEEPGARLLEAMNKLKY